MALASVTGGNLMVENRTSEQGTIVILRPNRSLSWMGNKLFLLLMAIPMFIIAIGWTILGAWPVLPFAGIDFLILAYCTYKICYQNYQHDSITIDKYQVTINHGVGMRKKRVLARCDTYLYVKNPVKPMDLPQLRLADNTEKVEIGKFLNKEDRELCRDVLKQAGLIECVDQWWES